jgi:voltage-gated potassium channel
MSKKSESTKKTPQGDPPLRMWDLVMAVLSIIMLVGLFLDMILVLDESEQRAMDYSDNFLCVIFMGDFFYRLLTAKDRLAFLKWGWIDFIASIPAIDMFRWGRVFRLLRILRAIRSWRHIHNVAKHKPELTMMLGTLLGCFLVLDFGSMIMLHVEKGREGANIQTTQDAFWWALTTVTTVGYGDRFPVTAPGRFVAAMLMVAGITLFATFTAFLSSKLMAPKIEEEEVELRHVMEKLDLVQERLSALEQKLDQTTSRRDA